MGLKITIGVLGILLLLTNVWWLYGAIDSGVTQKYEDQEIYELRNSNKQAVGMLREALIGRKKGDVKSIAEKFSDLKSYEKEGCLWVGWYGFKFSESDELVGIETNESYNTDPVCDIDL